MPQVDARDRPTDAPAPHRGPSVGRAHGVIAIVTTDPLVRLRGPFRTRSRVAIAPGSSAAAEAAAAMPTLVVLWDVEQPDEVASALRTDGRLATVPVIAVLPPAAAAPTGIVDDWLRTVVGDRELELRLQAWSRIAVLGRHIQHACPVTDPGRRYLDCLADGLAHAERRGLASLGPTIDELARVLGLVQRLLRTNLLHAPVFDLEVVAREALDRIALGEPWRLARTRVVWRNGEEPVWVKGDRTAILARVESLLVRALAVAQGSPDPWLGIAARNDDGATLELVAVGLGAALATDENVGADAIAIDPDCSAIARARFPSA